MSTSTDMLISLPLASFPVRVLSPWHSRQVSFDGRAKQRMVQETTMNAIISAIVTMISDVLQHVSLLQPILNLTLNILVYYSS